ncbi:MAG: hypothetical protein HC866_16340 [Leptolyngbyaceae cyanobacterium RU_5_1]|nr:hypothetical protein [Leptolyngbyaceae cyanobacterium RU_5_1]
MKHPLIPLAASLMTATVAPLSAVGTDAALIDFTLPVEQDTIDAHPPVVSESALPVAAAPNPTGSSSDAAVALNFDPPRSSSVAASAPSSPHLPTSPSPSSSPPPPASAVNPGSEALFTGGSDSLVARTVGAAEGTRTAAGGKTDLYEGHTDPGNGVWNRGTFSYQFGNTENLSAQEADRRQLTKIKRIHQTVLLSRAAAEGVAPLTLSEELNGIDLINQAPLAVTESGGYVERLAEAKQQGLTGEAAILEARVWAFWDPQREGWNAPGLSAYDDISKQESIRQDQKRRMGMIAEALESYEQQRGAVAEAKPQTRTGQRMATSPPPESPKQADPNKVADLIIFQDKAPQPQEQSEQLISSNW